MKSRNATESTLMECHGLGLLLGDVGGINHIKRVQLSYFRIKSEDEERTEEEERKGNRQDGIGLTAYSS